MSSSSDQQFAPTMPTSNWADGDLFANSWVMNELLKNENELLFLDPTAPNAEAHHPSMFVPPGFPEDFLMGGVEESVNSSACSPSSLSTVSSSVSAPEVPAFEAPAGSPIVLAPIRYAEPKIEMVAAVPQDHKILENAPAASNKRKISTSSSRTEVDTKAAAPVQQLSKRARANERNRKREAHNQAERERRDDLKEGYAALRMVLPTNLCPDRKNQVDLLQAAANYIAKLLEDSAAIEQEMTGLRTQLASVAPAAAPVPALVPAPAPSS